jgi:hypothetical protein
MVRSQQRLAVCEPQIYVTQICADLRYVNLRLSLTLYSPAHKVPITR